MPPWKCAARSRCDQSTSREASRCCRTNRRLRWILVTTIERGRADDFRLTVLNPGGHDPAQDFSDGVPGPNDSVHAPVNFHGYAACTGGAFHRDLQRAIAEGRPV